MKAGCVVEEEAEKRIDGEKKTKEKGQEIKKEKVTSCPVKKATKCEVNKLDEGSHMGQGSTGSFLWDMECAPGAVLF